MWKRVFLICAALAAAIPAAGFTRRSESPVRVPIVMYHSITNVRNNDYALSPAKLRADLDYLSAHGYKTVFVRDLIRYAEGLISLINLF